MIWAKYIDMDLSDSSVNVYVWISSAFSSIDHIRVLCIINCAYAFQIVSFNIQSIFMCIKII